MTLALSLSAVLHSSSALVANSEKLRANSCDRALLGPHSEAKLPKCRRRFRKQRQRVGLRLGAGRVPLSPSLLGFLLPVGVRLRE